MANARRGRGPIRALTRGRAHLAKEALDQLGFERRIGRLRRERGPERIAQDHIVVDTTMSALHIANETLYKYAIDAVLLHPLKMPLDGLGMSRAE